MPMMMAAGIGAGLNLLSTSIGSSKEKDAAKDILRAIESQKRENKAAYSEQKQIVSPWMEAGQTALTDIMAGIRNGSFDPGRFTFDASALEKDPGYQFRLNEGDRLQTQRIAAGGKFFSGQGQKALMQYNQDLASQEYGNAYNRAANEYGMEANRLGQRYNILSSVNQAGQNAANNIAQWRGDLARGNAVQTAQYADARQYQGSAEAAPWNALADVGGMVGGAGMKGVMAGV